MYENIEKKSTTFLKAVEFLNILFLSCRINEGCFEYRCRGPLSNMINHPVLFNICQRGFSPLL